MSDNNNRVRAALANTMSRVGDQVGQVHVDGDDVRVLLAYVGETLRPDIGALSSVETPADVESTARKRGRVAAR